MVDQVLFDTSSLVPSLLEEHPFHQACLPWFIVDPKNWTGG